MTVVTGPIYRRIASSLEADIAAGRLKEGDKLPSERAMAESLGISRMTARQALRHLAARGILVARTGQGTFVGERVIQQKLSTLTGFTEEMERQGREASSIVVAAGPGEADKPCADALSLPVSGAIHRLVRVRLADQKPVAMETTEVRADIAPGLLDIADFARQSLYDILRDRYRIEPTSAEQSLKASSVPAEVGRTLELTDNAAVLELTRRTFDGNGNPFEYVRSVYRGDAFVMKVDLNLGAEVTQ